MKSALLLLAILTAFTLPASAQSEANSPDSTLVAYYRWCTRHKEDPESLFKADTMFRLAGEKQNKRMQAVALCLKTDYYYFTKNLDSLKVWVDRTQQFARKHNLLMHYYFVWTRLISYYTTFSKYTLAQYELERYRDQAISDDYKSGIAEAYKQLGHIYRAKGLYTQAAEAYKKGIEQVEQNDLKEIDKSYLYLQLGESYMFLNNFEKADEAFAKALESILLPEHIWRVKVAQANRYVQIGDFTLAHQYLSEIKKKGSQNISENKINELEFLIYKNSGDLQKALELVNKQLTYYKSSGDSVNSTHYSHIPLLVNRANINFKLRNYKAAAEDLFEEIALAQKKYENDNREALNEFATLLDVERLDREKAEAQQQVQTERLRQARVLESALIIVIFLAVAFIVILTRFNRRLAHAKRDAEKANHMKGVFIRNITHEINTPLNAIVGFAELASMAPPDDAERDSYLDIIQKNSDYLQKLIDDVLYIADLESSEVAPACTEIDINACCRTCIANLSKAMSSETEIRFQPAKESLSGRTAGVLLTKALTELLRNAVRYTDPLKGVTLSYSIAEDGHSITFAVEDAGPGVPEGQHEQIFERFVKLDSFTQGLGLGLSLSRMIARALGGDVRLDTSYAPGARFLLTIPIK